MRTLILVMAILSGLLIFSTIVCGLWIRSNPDQVEDLEGSIKFHMMIGLATALSSAATIVLAVATVFKAAA